MRKLMLILTVAVFSATATMATPYANKDAPKECTVTIKGTYDGKPINVTVTFQADNCAEGAGKLLKAAIK
jgi:hypothetical protein